MTALHLARMAVCLACCVCGCQARVSEFSTKRPIGLLHKPLGETAIITGRIVDCEYRKDCPTLIEVESIDGKPERSGFELRLVPYFNDFGETPTLVDGELLPVMTRGQRYECEVYESGGFVGFNRDASETMKVKLQSGPFRISSYAVVFRARRLEAIESSPPQSN